MLTDFLNTKNSDRIIYGEGAIGDDAVSIASCHAGEKVMRFADNSGNFFCYIPNFNSQIVNSRRQHNTLRIVAIASIEFEILTSTVIVFILVCPFHQFVYVNVLCSNFLTS